MTTIDQREQNLFNATDTLAQFYDEIESFMDILFNNMERLGFSVKAERLRPGTFTVSNLPRRLLATATVIYVREEVGGEVLEQDDEVDEEPEDDGGEVAKAGKEEIVITGGLRIPFVSLFLFPPRLIPSVRTLTSPQLLFGALGNMLFVEKKTGQPAAVESPSLSLSNLVQMSFSPKNKAGDKVRVNCWPKAMRRYRMESELIALESRRLLEIDAQEKVREIAEKLSGYCQPIHV